MRIFFQRRFCAIVCAGSLSFASGCAIHPLPEDVAPLKTVEIVDHIRCEMYDALRHQIVLIFDYTDNAEAHQIARDIEAHPGRSLKEFEGKIKLLKPVYQHRINAYASTTIGYGFRFNITEQNVAKADVFFGLPWNPLSNFVVKANSTLDKTRTNTRRFFKVETFKDLLLSSDCLGQPLNEANIVYPITGSIGLRNVVDDFFKLTTRGAKTVQDDSKDVRNFSEQLTFTTAISGSINPRVQLSPVTDAFKLAEAGADLTASRTDIHELTLTFDLGTGFDPHALVAGAPARSDAVIRELSTLRLLDAAERGGAAVVVP